MGICLCYVVSVVTDCVITAHDITAKKGKGNHAAGVFTQPFALGYVSSTFSLSFCFSRASVSSSSFLLPGSLLPVVSLSFLLFPWIRPFSHVTPLVSPLTMYLSTETGPPCPRTRPPKRRPHPLPNHRRGPGRVFLRLRPQILRPSSRSPQNQVDPRRCSNPRVLEGRERDRDRAFLGGREDLGG